jgi:hypothetical protein
VAGAIEVIEGVSWPLDAATMRILDVNGLVVHERGRADGR